MEENSENIFAALDWQRFLRQAAESTNHRVRVGFNKNLTPTFIKGYYLNTN